MLGQKEPLCSNFFKKPCNNKNRKESRKSVGLRFRDTSLESDGSNIHFMNHLLGWSTPNTDNIFGDLRRYQSGSVQAMIDQIAKYLVKEQACQSQPS